MSQTIVVDEDNETTVDSTEIAEAIEIVAKNDPDGLIQPHAVVEAARDPESPLHPHFTWDDTEAAAAYRLVQARSLIAHVRITVVDHGPGPALVNVRIRTESGDRRGYMPVARVVADPDLCAQAIADARRGIATYRLRLSAFEQARAAVEHLDAALHEMS